MHAEIGNLMLRGVSCNCNCKCGAEELIIKHCSDGVLCRNAAPRLPEAFEAPRPYLLPFRAVCAPPKARQTPFPMPPWLSRRQRQRHSRDAPSLRRPEAVPRCPSPTRPARPRTARPCGSWSSATSKARRHQGRALVLSGAARVQISAFNMVRTIATGFFSYASNCLSKALKRTRTVDSRVSPGRKSTTCAS